MVTPTYYVTCNFSLVHLLPTLTHATVTFFTLVTSVILYRGLKASGAKIMTMVLAFFVICSGIFVLQMSKINPKNLNKAVVDQKSSLLLETARQEVEVDLEKEGDDDDGQLLPTQNHFVRRSRFY
jgi:4-amino-4-deoxy-L-arabinose transferase-like glycosyltransferase